MVSRSPDKISGQDKLLRLFFNLVRNVDDNILQQLIMSFKHEKSDILEDLIVLWWQTRAVRGKGKGERHLFYSMIPHIIEVVDINVVINTIHLIPHYGYYKDFCFIFDAFFNKFSKVPY